RLWGPSAGLVAAVLTGLAYPGTTIFVPGRIDHHALQVVLIQGIVLCLMRSPSLYAGVVAGVLTGISLVVGLETVPQIAVLVSVTAFLWVVRGMDERGRLVGFAAGLTTTTVLCLLFLRPNYWTAQLCDAFTPASSTGTLAVSLALVALALSTPVLTDLRTRLLAGAGAGAAALAGTLLAFPACIAGPYGKVDPFLLANFIPFIDEANGLFVQPQITRAIAIGGVLIAACLASIWLFARERQRWPVLLPIIAVVLVSGLVVMVQTRGTYIGTPLGAPVLAGLVILARRRETWQLPSIVAAWLFGSGLIYLELPDRLIRLVKPNAEPAFSRTILSLCSAGDTWRNVDKYPKGMVAAGSSTAAFFIGATHHSTLGPGYHRNNSGNMAMYRIFLSAPETSQNIARRWKVDYVAFCPGDFQEIAVTKTYPHSLASQLQAGKVPAWLKPLPLQGTPLRFYRIQ
ncbi:MAG: hypothetical protein K2X59_04780, partial [Sphingomonas sp.]|nr:hypothetical protein [Sphingomonas sp.]